jgi:hypothetical protein
LIPPSLRCGVIPVSPRVIICPAITWVVAAVICPLITRAICSIHDILQAVLTLPLAVLTLPLAVLILLLRVWLAGFGPPGYAACRPATPLLAY